MWFLLLPESGDELWILHGCTMILFGNKSPRW